MAPRFFGQILSSLKKQSRPLRLSAKAGLQSLIPPNIRSRLGIPLNEGSQRFRYDSLESVDLHIKREFGYNGEMLKCFMESSGARVNKWHHYIPLYDRYFSRFRGGQVRMLEIGVANGGSLAMWRKYFGPDATLYGIDINPECMRFDGQHAQVRIGSQSDTDFLRSVIVEMGGIDIVLDDGSHAMSDIRESLLCLFPSLENGGLYFIEDLHTCYWRGWGGGYRSKKSFFSMVSELIDDMHFWYHDAGINHGQVGASLRGLHVHDSVVVLEKGFPVPPVHSDLG